MVVRADYFNDAPIFLLSLLGLRDVAIHEAVWIATGLKALAMTSLIRYACSFINTL
jgi:hypothetical protein